MLKGILFSVFSNLLFGVGYYFAILLRPLDDKGMFGFRITVVLPIILLVILLFAQHKTFLDLLQKIRQKPPLVFIVLLLALNTGVQLWLFLYAPNNGQALQVSIGYLLMPIITAALGKMVFKEHFTALKWAALAFAVLGVMINLLVTNSVSWATFVAGFGYPIYIVLRRYFHINTLATFFVELCLCLPLALYFLAQIEIDFVLEQNTNFFFYLVLFGLVNGVAFIFYIRSSNLLPINVLGLIGYLEPLVMLLISFAIGEVLKSQDYILMVCLAFSVVLLMWDSFRKTS